MDSNQLTLKEAKEIALKKSILVANRWKHRRRMAYMAMISVVAMTYHLMLYIPVEKVKALETIITWYYITMGSIIGAYVGFATLDDKWKKDKDKEE